MEKQPLKAGTRVACVSRKPNSDLNERGINNRIEEIETEAHDAGFLVSIQSVSSTESETVIVYTLQNDPFFRSPIG